MRSCCFFLVNLMVIASMHIQVTACCMVPNDYSIDTVGFGNADDPAIIVNVHMFQSDVFADTLYSSEMLRKLKEVYDSSKLVIVVQALQAKRFAPELIPNLTMFASESVTVQIEQVIKGQVENYQKTFIHPIRSEMHELVYDSARGEYVRITSIRSISDPYYGQILGKRFILFFAEKPVSDMELFSLPLPGLCQNNTYSYQINETNEIFFDGVQFDPESKSVSQVPYLTVDLNRFLEYVEGTSVLDKRGLVPTNNRKQDKLSVYNLLGKKVSAISKAKSGNYSPALYIEADRNGQGAVVKRLRY